MNNDLAALFGGGFQPATVEPQTDFQVLPPGKYPCLIEAAEVKQTKALTGHYIRLTLSVLDGQYKNRKLFDQINIQNPSAQCVEIGRRCLSALGRAIGLQVITDTAQLLQGVVIAHVKVGKDQNGNDQNNIRTYSAPTEAGPTRVDVARPAYMASPDPAPTPAPTAAPVTPPPVASPAPVAVPQSVAQQAATAPTTASPPWAR